MSNFAIYILFFVVGAVLFGGIFEFCSRRPHITIPRVSALASWGSCLLVGGIASYMVGVNVIIGAVTFCAGCFVGLIAVFIYAMCTTKRGLF